MSHIMDADEIYDFTSQQEEEGDVPWFKAVLSADGGMWFTHATFSSYGGAEEYGKGIAGGGCRFLGVITLEGAPESVQGLWMREV